MQLKELDEKADEKHLRVSVQLTACLLCFADLVFLQLVEVKERTLCPVHHDVVMVSPLREMKEE